MLPDIARHAEDFTALGIEFAFARLDEVALNELAFADPSGPDAAAGRGAHVLAAPVRAASEHRLWLFRGVRRADCGSRALGSVLGSSWDWSRSTPSRSRFRKVVVASTDLNLGLYDLDLREPVLTFSDPDMPTRIENLRERGYRFAPRLPRGIDSARSAMLLAPEGTSLLLTTSSD